MTVRRNIVANYVGQGFTALLGLAFVPFYIRYLTMEAYGLVGLFAVVQAWLTLLDLGMTPTLSREMARFAAGAVPVQFIRDLLRSLEILCAGIAAVIAAAMMLGSAVIASHWLKAGHLPVDMVAHALTIMAVVVALRFCEGIYRSALIGLQQQLWLNAAGVGLAVLRSVGSVAVLAFVAPTIEAFFVWQGLVSLLTLGLFGAKLHFGLPPAPRPARFTIAALIEVRSFAGGMIGITFLAVLLTQVDKLLLSRLLPLESFGYYMLASTVAGAIFLVVAPITQAVYPALVRHAVADDSDRLGRTYHATAQLVTVVIAPAAALLVAFPQTILFAWSGNIRLTLVAAPILALLAIGNFCNGVMQVPLQLQLASGWTRLLLTVNVAALIILLPALVWTVPRHGAIAAAAIWLVLNASHLVIQLPLMHRRLLRGERVRWYVDDVALPLGGVLAIVIPAAMVRPDGLHDRLGSLAFLLTTGGAALVAAALSAATVRRRLVPALAYAWTRRLARP